MSFRLQLPPVRLPPATVVQLGTWTYAALACAACVGGQSFDDGRDGLGRGNSKSDAAQAAPPDELDAAAAPSVEAMPPAAREEVDSGAASNQTLPGATATNEAPTMTPVDALQDAAAPVPSNDPVGAPVGPPEVEAQDASAPAEPDAANNESSEGPLTSLDSGERGPADNSVSRAIPGVLLLADAEGAYGTGFIPDATLTEAGLAMQGGWYTYDDVLDCPISEQPRPGMISPAKGTTFGVTDLSDQGLDYFLPELDVPNENAYRIWGGGHLTWGAGFGISFDNPGGKPRAFDLTKTGATGIRFWARSDSEQVLIKVWVQDKWSEPSAEPMLCCFLDPTVCGANSCGEEEKQGCVDAPAYQVAVGESWQLYEIPFTSFQRIGFGTWADGQNHTQEPLALTDAYQLQFEVGALEQFDVYFDNIGLIVPE